jgi:DNA-binding transcriptional MerR regulator
MFTIGEFARFGGVSVRTLRYYEEIGLLLPAEVDASTGYRHYVASQLSLLNRIVALKDLGLTLEQVAHLVEGVSVGEMWGMLALRRAQLEQAIAEQADRLAEVEARLRYIEKEGTMPPDDVVSKVVAPLPVVAITGTVPEYGTPQIMAEVNRLEEQFVELRIHDLVEVVGPYVTFYEGEPGDAEIAVNLGLAVAAEPSELPPSVRYLVLPEMRAAVAVRTGRVANVFPFVYFDLAAWIEQHGYRPNYPGRELYLNPVTDISEADKQVFEVQLPYLDA